MRLVLAPVLLILASGCGLFCPPATDCASNGAVIVRVLDATTGAPLPNATVLASSAGQAEKELAPCRLETATSDGGTHCRAIIEPGTYHLTVRAQGYVETTLDVTAASDSCGHWKAQEREVRVQPVGSSQQALVNSGEACGG